MASTSRLLLSGHHQRASDAAAGVLRAHGELLQVRLPVHLEDVREADGRRGIAGMLVGGEGEPPQDEPRGILAFLVRGGGGHDRAPKRSIRMRSAARSSSSRTTWSAAVANRMSGLIGR